MSDKPDSPPPTKPRSSEGGSGSSGWWWFVLLAGVIVALVVGVFDRNHQVRIPISELRRLIEAGAPEQNPQASVSIDEGSPSEPLTVRYSQLEDLVIGPAAISGAVQREVVSPPEKATPPQKVRFVSGRVGLENDNNELFALAMSKGFRNVRAEEAPSGWRQYGPTLLITAVLIFGLIFLMRRMGGPGSAMAFGRSKGRLYAQEDVGITFNDVAGLDEAVEELREVVDFLREPQRYQRLGGRIPRGVLLVGPPGTGKTLLAKAIAGEANAPFFSLSGSDFVEMFVGVGAARVRDMFSQAQAKAPCIVFIDELDALGKTRGSGLVGGHDEREQTLNALLVEMDGFSGNSGVIVLAATNRPETLDPALLRPGRFDRQVLVDRPDVRGREAILRVHLRNVCLADDVDASSIARLTPGFVGADLANLVNEAALLAARKGNDRVTMAELNEGIERVSAGLEKRQRMIHPEEKQRVAYHESAHALVAYCLPNTDPVHKVSIIPRGLAALGYTMQRPEGDRYLLTQSELESRIQVLLAGTLAEEMILADISSGAQNDLQRATEIARAMVMDFGMSRLGRITFRDSPRAAFIPGDEIGHAQAFSQQTAREIDQEIRRIIDEAQENARQVLTSRREALVAIAERLIEKETIDSDELRALIEAHSPSPSIVPGTAERLARSAPTIAAANDAGEPLDAPAAPQRPGAGEARA